MGTKYAQISEKQQAFIEKQKMFFVATAGSDVRINISPKDTNSLKILNKNHLLWLNKVGSGNETAAHIQRDKRMTIMFCSFEGKPFILRLYGVADEIKPDDKDWEKSVKHFDDTIGARQIFSMSIEVVHTSCGFGVPLFDYLGQREFLNNWAIKKGKDGLEKYKQDNNVVSIDGKKIKI